MKPIVIWLKKEYSGRVDIVKLNISDPKTAQARAKHKFRAQPYFVLLDAEGEVMKTWQGSTEKGLFDEVFATVLDQ